ncbi:MAG: imidazolonepropionase [Gemmatimonadales bacterium]|nr:Imidazolonepropionase [bacterium HR33]GIW52001.1 MAG: imidazolonepropionase [Gemmatimonadales bacterium]
MRAIGWIITAAFGLLPLAGGLDAQQQGRDLAIRGGRIHTLAGPAIENGTVLIRNGRIAEVGTNVTVPAGIPVIDATGLEVYPGLFDAMTRLGLTEIGQVDVTNDFNELGEFNPHLSAATAIHPASEHIPVARANGITHAVSAPQARPAGIGGQATVINLDGWTIEEMMVEPSVGIVLNWPSLRTGGFGFFGQQQGARTFREARERYERNVRRLEEWLEEARRYDAAVQAGQAVPRDLKLEALAKVTRRELPFLVGADEERDIRNAVEFMEKHNVRMILVGGREAWKVRELLAEKQIPVIAGPTQTLPTGQDEGYDEMYAAPGLLYQAGVKFAFGTFNSSDSRTLPYEAGSAVSFGLPREQALRAITVNGAEILGLGDRLGTIEPGKIANLIVTDGDPLEIRTQVKHVIIAGRDVGTDNRHLELYLKYRARPKPQPKR